MSQNKSRQVFVVDAVMDTMYFILDAMGISSLNNLGNIRFRTQLTLCRQFISQVFLRFYSSITIEYCTFRTAS